MVRSIGSVVAGYLAWTVVFLGASAGIRAIFADVHDAEGLTADMSALVLYLIVSIIASLAAGFVCARIAVRRMARHAFVLGILLLATGIPVQLSVWDKLPPWYNYAFLAMLIPATLAGVRLAGPELVD